MRITRKNVISFFCAFCLLLSIICSEGMYSSAEVVWEDTYYKTPTDYYAGGETNSISVTDGTFADWSGQDLVRIDSREHPENWQYTEHIEDASYSYSLAWNQTNLYFYIQVDGAMTFLKNNCPKFYFDISPASSNHLIGIIEFKYDEEIREMKLVKATHINADRAAFLAAIKFHAAEIDGKTYLEVAIPWLKMGETISFDTATYISYNMYIRTQPSGNFLYAQDTSVWTTSTYPWANSTHYLNMYFSDGEPTLMPITPTPLTTSTIISSSFREVNCALGKTYTGTVGTDSEWPESNGAILTEGSFQSTENINGNYMEGFTVADFENDDSIVKIIDLGEPVSGLYKFEVGAAQNSTDGIVFPSEVKIYASANEMHYQYLGDGEAADYESKNDDVLKETQKYIVTLPEGVEARYVKIKIIPPESSYQVVAISEITAIRNTAISQGEEIDPILSLGAKVNKELKGLRFGAKFTKIESKEVEQLGMLLYPTTKLGAAELDMNYYLANPYSESNQAGVILINAVAVAKSDYVQSKNFIDYTSFTFFITLLSIPDAQLSTNITAVPFIRYADGSVIYGVPLIRNYGAVLAATDAVQE